MLVVSPFFKTGLITDTRQALGTTLLSITNAPRAGLFTVFARTDPTSKTSAGVTAFLVEAGTPGFHRLVLDALPQIRRSKENASA